MTEANMVSGFGIFNVKGLKKIVHAMDQMAKKMTILGISETWQMGTTTQ